MLFSAYFDVIFIEMFFIIVLSDFPPVYTFLIL